MFLKIEAALSVLALALAFTVPNLGSHWFEAIERSFGKLARRRGLSVVVVGLTALALRLALLTILPVPTPAAMDEFSYLLIADTFAHGRLANPTSPMWPHLESPLVLWQPTHVGIYHPAQGLFMAVGQVLLGHPFWGVWLSVGIMCAAITWMLQAWVGEGWALLAGFLAVIRLGTYSYWADSYWGGAVAAIGGALVLGALPRMKQERRVRHAVLMGVGFAILANSRPYEGLFFGLPIALALLVWLWKLKRPELGQALKRAVVPLLGVLALALVVMGYYFWRTTGNPTTPPYLVAGQQGDVPPFPWQKLKPAPHFRYAAFEKLHKEFALARYELAQSATGRAAILWFAFEQFWSFYFGFVFTFPFLLAWVATPYGFSLKDISPATRFLVLVCSVTLAGEALPIWYNAHYSAELTCVILALVLTALRYVRPWQWRGRPVGRFITRAVPAICLLLLATRMAAGPLKLRLTALWPRSGLPIWCTTAPKNPARAAVLRKLRQMPGRQLVIVRYNPGHNIYFNEWVYNRADLDSAKVIFAHDMGPEKNKELIDYFKGRRVWLVYADERPPRLEAYPDSQAASGDDQTRTAR
jgi:hypothetical protein